MTAPGSSSRSAPQAPQKTTPVKPRLPFNREELDSLSKPKVLISGGGIGGLTLAILLHKADIPFLVLERAKEIKPLGAAFTIGTHIAPLLQQLDMYDDFLDSAKLAPVMELFNEELKPLFNIDTEMVGRLGGSQQYTISRPSFYGLLLSRIPREAVLLGKRVLSYSQDDSGVVVRCSDNSSYTGDILVGADGAYSAVRQQLYKDLKLKSKLPRSDDVSLPFNCVCLVGQTVPLDPKEFPSLKSERSEVSAVLGQSTMCTWFTLTTAQNTVCWTVIQFLDKESSKRTDSFRNSEWGTEAAEALAREVRVFKVPGGKDGKVRTLGEYIDKTPHDLMSKVMLEEIVFDTWYGGRVVLLGDACHKMNPCGGAGALNAIHDAVTLANWMSTLRFADVPAMEKIFKEYHKERYPFAKESFHSSQLFSKNLGKNLTATIIRTFMKRLPPWLWKQIYVKMIAARPQLSFIPQVKDQGTVKPTYQRSLHKTLAILKDLAENPAIVTTESSAPVTV